ncbi:helix-turn-helix domain-containing protein [Taibaiella chishuiensis]|uniref:Helix-turn-helix protein n=1 Tax=Taibaiella chishuiensis TaxID=1434707 RepID=A0A2P8D8C1_9BACT|nr:helix-turn-helix domain-containing protein [Taibaiella chishuiensis]PSK93476.1 helix-turn-helix protein [Taibaiella chishuiensis]
MNTYRLSPPAALAAYVSGILVIELHAVNDPFVLPLYANGSPTIVFQTVTGFCSGGRTGYLSLFGQTVKPAQLALSGPFTFIAYFMRPHTLQPLFGIGPAALSDTYADLEYVMPAKTRGLVDQLLHAPSLNRRLDFLNAFVTSLVQDAGSLNAAALMAASYFDTHVHAAALADLQQLMKISERSLQRLFENHIGVSPKMYKRICQFDKAFQQLNRNDFRILTDIAYGHDFADQSHYNRVFREFTGITPQEYIRLSKPFNPEF